MPRKSQVERDIEEIQTKTAASVWNMQWRNVHVGIRFCNAMASALLEACIERTSTRVVNGREERRHYYRAGIPQETITRLRSLVSTSDGMINAKGPYKQIYGSDLWDMLRGLAVPVSQLRLDREAVARIESVYRWRDYTGKEALPDDETLLAFEAIVELEDYNYAAEFARQHTRTDAWKGIVRLPVSP